MKNKIIPIIVMILLVSFVTVEAKKFEEVGDKSDLPCGGGSCTGTTPEGNELTLKGRQWYDNEDNLCRGCVVQDEKGEIWGTGSEGENDAHPGRRREAQGRWDLETTNWADEVFNLVASSAAGAEAICGLYSIPYVCTDAIYKWICGEREGAELDWFRAALCTDWATSLCQRWADWDFNWWGHKQFKDLPNVPTDQSGSPILWATAEYQLVKTVEEFEEKQTYLYRINFQINPIELCDVPRFKPSEDADEEEKEKEQNEHFKDEFLIFDVYLKRNGEKQMLDFDLDGEPDQTKIRCDHGLYGAVGTSTLIRYYDGIYDEICIGFKNKNNILGTFTEKGFGTRIKGSPPLSGGEMCNKVASTDPEINTGRYGGSGSSERLYTQEEMTEMKNP